MRLAIALAMLVGCNQLIGVHDYAVDAGGDACSGQCECTIDSDCTDPHAVCLDHNTCTCSAGYALVTGTCEWVGVVDDPGFERQPDLWTPSGNVLFEPGQPQGTGMVDPGDVKLGLDARCFGAAVAQQVTMPRYARAQPLVLATSYSSHFGYSSLTPVVGIGPVWYRNDFPLFDGTAHRTCLGPGNYAPEASTGVGESVAFIAGGDHIIGGVACTPPDSSVLLLDHIEVLPAAPDECPLPGQVLNGDAELTGGWTFTSTGTSTGDLEPCAQPASAPAAGHCARLHTTTGCDQVTTRLQLSVPLASGAASPALHLYYAASPGLTLKMAVDQGLGGNQLAIGGNGAHSYCLPAYMRGGVYTFTATATAPADALGKCGTAVDLSAYLDNVTIDTNGACLADPYITDPGFESGGGSYSLIDANAASILVDTPNAHGGSAFLRLTAACSANYTAWISTPAPTGSGGPALHYWYRYKSATMGTTFVTTVNGRGGTAAAPAPAAGWQEITVCLDPHQTGWPQSVDFRLQTSGVLGCPTDSLDIDDLSAIISPACS